MRLWTLHPRYLDAKGLVAAWREALLAQKVLKGATRGYRNHPQLIRFRQHTRPLPAIATFLRTIAEEADQRGYQFDKSKIAARPKLKSKIKETHGQLAYEWERLRAKLKSRSPETYLQFKTLKKPSAHPLFRIIPGKIRDWEKR
jgi:hypothetical protein